jgi:hypothetical protein
MSFLSSGNKERFGALIDIGSGSVLVAILRSDAEKTYPEIIWSKREYSPLRNVTSLDESAKHVMTALVNALMALDSEGRKAFSEKTGHNKLPETQVTIAAPWSYTITKNISYAHGEPFTLSDELIEELLRTAHKKVDEDITEHERAHQLGLTIISRSVIGLSANGYNLLRPNNQSAKTLRVVEASAVAQDYLVTAIKEAGGKVLPDSTLHLYSFIMIFYSIIRDIHPESTEYCLVDITYEATELGIVRDGILTYTTHAPYGSFSLAREIAAVLGTPLEEAFGYLHDSDLTAALSSYSLEKQAEVQEIFTAYRKRLTDLFHETGDALSIPKRIFLHGNLHTEAFYAEQVGEAAKAATKASHAVYPVSKELIDKNYPKEMGIEIEKTVMDTALLISAQFFHMREYHSRFEHY